MSDLEDATRDSKDAVRSLVQSSIIDGVEDEKCVVAQYRTTSDQKDTFIDHLGTCPRSNIPIEWVIDIADESNGWFYGTAYHFDDTTQMLHVMVPDKENPSFDGQVLLDHRTVHLIECVDGKSDALFNKIVRDSVIKIKWDVEWFEESEDGTGEAQSWAADGTTGSWVTSSARYYIRIANQLLVEDKDLGQESRGFVIINADLNLKLLRCHKGKGVEDFQRLILEGIVQSSPQSNAEAQQYAANVPDKGKGPGIIATPSAGKDALVLESEDTGGRDKRGDTGEGQGQGESPLKGSAFSQAGKLADMSTDLRECVVEILDDRDRMKAESVSIAEMFRAFALSGDLDQGMQLMTHCESVKDKADRQLAAQMSEVSVVEEDDKMEAVADDAVYLAQKLERSLGKIARSGGAVSTSTAEEIETLRKSLRKSRDDMQEKDDLIRKMRAEKV